jgi:hypothetical protein
MSALKEKVFQKEYLNDFMALSRPHWIEARTRIQEIFSINSPLKGE